MEQNHFWEAKSRSGGEETPRFFKKSEGSLPFSQKPGTGQYP